MRLLILVDIGDLWWCGDEGQAGALLACGDHCDDVILGAAEDFHCKQIFAVKGNRDNPTSFDRFSEKEITVSAVCRGEMGWNWM